MFSFNRCLNDSMITVHLLFELYMRACMCVCVCVSFCSCFVCIEMPYTIQNEAQTHLIKLMWINAFVMRFKCVHPFICNCVRSYEKQ